MSTARVAGLLVLLVACEKGASPPDALAASASAPATAPSVPPSAAASSAPAPSASAAASVAPTPSASAVASASAVTSASAVASAPPAPATFPALDATCATDADCTTTGQWGNCCGVCEQRYANLKFEAQVQAYCKAHPPPKCPPMACSWGMSAPQCRAGKCQAHK